MATINIRVDEKLKNKASRTFDRVGLDMSSAIKLFLSQSIVEEGLPFQPSTKTQKEIVKVWGEAVIEALKNSKRYRSAEEMHKDISG